MKITKKTRLLAGGAPLFEDGPLRLDSIVPATGSNLVAGETWKVSGRELKSYIEGLQGGICYLGWSTGVDGENGICEFNFDDDGRSGTVRMLQSDLLAAGSRDVKFDVATRTADDQPGKFDSFTLTVIKE